MAVNQIAERNGAWDTVQKRLAERFGGTVLTVCQENDNEYYVNLDARLIRGAAGYIHTELGYPLLALFANDERSLCGRFAIYYVFADRKNGFLCILRTMIEPEACVFFSICDVVPAASGYEREIFDLFGLMPSGHPDPKRLVFHGNWPDGMYPLRKEFDKNMRPPFAEHEITFRKVRGEGIYEIPVGPVHAGIIEPGHFRFSVAGEPIINLEAQLYYVHKGIEKLCEGETIERGLYFSERISGDETFANSLAYCRAIEKIAGITIPERASYSRAVFAELERLTSHLGDLAGLCLDTAYGFATFQFRMMRGWAYAIADELCGMRFLRSVNRPGGIRRDFLAGKEALIVERLETIKAELADTADIIRKNSLFIDRVEHTGILKQQIAEDLHAVGPGARASGIGADVRKDFPYERYTDFDFTIPEYTDGDICCRMNVKLEECFTSIALMQQAIRMTKAGEINTPIGELPSGRFACGLVEAARGETVHWLMTGENNTIYRYKIRTASFCNWPALCYAVNGNTVPDFPLVNKSFNLSYAGNDL